MEESRGRGEKPQDQLTTRRQLQAHTRHRSKQMNILTQIANHLEVSPNQITKIEEWENCYFVVVKGLGGRFVSKKVVKTVVAVTAYEVELSKLCRKVRKANHTLAGRRQRAMFC